jgi:Variant SH3 domain
LCVCVLLLQVKDLRDKTGADASKVANNEMKLESAKLAVHKATLSVYKAFNYYDAIMGRLVTPEIEMFKAAQVSFYSAALNCVKDVPLRDPAQVAADIDRLGEDGCNRPITTGYEGHGIAGGGSGSYTPGASFSAQGSSSHTAASAYGGATAAGMYASDTSSPGIGVPVAASAPWMTNAGASTATAGTGGGQGGAWWDQQAGGTGKQSGGYGGESLPVAAEVNPFMPPPPQQQQQSSGERAKVLYDYGAHDNTELTLTLGEIIRVVEKHESGWWVGERNGAKGLFPANYVQML